MTTYRSKFEPLLKEEKPKVKLIKRIKLAFNNSRFLKILVPIIIMLLGIFFALGYQTGKVINECDYEVIGINKWTNI